MKLVRIFVENFRVSFVFDYKKKITRLTKILLIACTLIFKAGMVSAKEDWRCGVRLVFDSDVSGSVASYILGLQVKNNTGRNINGVSVIYKDSKKNVIGNSLLSCSAGTQFVKPGSYGECLRVLQKVDGAYINSFGVEKWTEIVNNQLKTLNEIQYCEILGFSY